MRASPGQPVEKASQSLRPQAQIKFKAFLPAACTSAKILLGSQTCERKRVRCGEPQPFQTRAQRSGSRLRACQKYFLTRSKPSLFQGRLSDCQKSLAEFAPAGAKNFNHFSPRHVRGEKFLSGCKCGILPPDGKIMRAADCKPFAKSSDGIFGSPKDERPLNFHIITEGRFYYDRLQGRIPKMAPQRRHH